uniref:GAB2 n=1 Tax=Neolamprologus brichardi TaxID=32507 RepID=A0A3Q4M5P9_NEOBR
MSPGPHHFDFPGFSATLPARKASSASLCHRPSRLSDVTPPPIYRDLKPDRKCEILTLSFSLLTKSMLQISSKLCCKLSKTMIFVNNICSCFSAAKPTPLDLKNNGIIDELPFKSPVTMSWTRPIGTSSPAPRKCGNVDYLALEFQPGTPNPHRKKVDYVQVDKEKTQALQNTMQEWTDVRQSTEPLIIVKKRKKERKNNNHQTRNLLSTNTDVYKLS